jgi:Alginate export
MGRLPVSFRACVPVLLSVLFVTSSASAQQAAPPVAEGVINPFHSPVDTTSRVDSTNAGLQSLHLSDIPSWMTLDLQLRGRTEEQTALGYVSGKDRLYELTRVWGGVNMRATDWLTVYAQFMDVHALGLPLKDTAANMRDTFDLRQGYLDLHYKALQVMVGRKELRFADKRLIGISDWTNTSRTFDGFFMDVGQKNHLDLFSASVVQIHPTSLDTHGAGLTFHGAHARLTTLVPKTTIEPMVLVHALPRVTSQQGMVGSQTEVTFGSYYETKLPLGFDSSGSGMLQRGSYSNDSIHAGSAIFRGGYGAAWLPWKPHLEGEYDYATGNTHTNAMRIGTFDQEYPSNHNAFGLVDLFGFQNITQRRVSLQLTPRNNFAILLQGGSLRLATVHDGVYTGSGTSLFAAPTGGFKSDDMGSEFDASAKYIFHKSFVTNIGVGHFFPGEVMNSANHGAPLTLAYLSLTYRFKVEH